MNHISTHILDLGLGRPAAGVDVRLEKQESTQNWKLIGSAQTDQDGRCLELLNDAVSTAGTYRLHFETAMYFATRNIETLYPFVEITFQVRDGDSHFHIPLLLSATGYTTYRGT